MRTEKHIDMEHIEQNFSLKAWMRSSGRTLGVAYMYIFKQIKRTSTCMRIFSPAVYHKRGNHTVTLYEKRVEIRYHLRGSPLG